MCRTFLRTSARIGLPGLTLGMLLSCAPPPPPAAVEVVYVERRPPPPRVEVIGPRPGPAFVWIRGYWEWGGGDYRWRAGRWVMPERGHKKWEPGHWKKHGHAWYWVEGRWR